MTYWRYYLIGRNFSVVVVAAASIGQPVVYQTITEGGNRRKIEHQILEELLNLILDMYIR